MGFMDGCTNFQEKLDKTNLIISKLQPIIIESIGNCNINDEQLLVLEQI